MPSFLPKPAWPQLQRGDPLARGLVGAWPFYEGAAPTLHDLSGGQHNGSFVFDTTAPSWTGGQYGSSVSFTTAGRNGVLVPNASSLSPTATITISILFRVRTLSADNFLIMKGDANGPATSSYWLRKFSDNAFYFYLNLNGVDTQINSSATLTDANWHHFAGTYDGANMRIYVDGLKVADVAHTGTIGTNTVGLQMGSNHVIGSGFTDGNIAEARVYNRALSAGEIAQIYQDPFRIYRPRSRWWETVRASSGIRRVIRAGILRLGQLLNH